MDSEEVVRSAEGRRGLEVVLELRDRLLLKMDRFELVRLPLEVEEEVESVLSLEISFLEDWTANVPMSGSVSLCAFPNK